MFKPLIVYIGLRYTRAKRRSQFISFITLMSVSGIALSVMALITVLSVMNGLAEEFNERVLSMTTHITITGKNKPLKNWQKIEQTIKHLPHIKAVAPQINEQVMINAGRRMSGVMMNAILPGDEKNVSDLADKMIDSKLTDLTPGQNGIIVGYDLAVYLGVAPGDNITVISPHVNAGSSSIMPKMYRFTVIGLFKFGLPDYDRNIGYIHINDAAQFFGYDTSVSALKVKLDDSLTAPVVSHSLVDILPNDYEVSDWVMENKSRFQAIKTEKKVMTIILILMIIESAFSIVSALIMLVKEKRSDIAILKTMGLTSNSVMGIFVVLGTIIGITGTSFGVFLGVLLSTHISTILLNVENFLNIKVMDSKLFIISEFPSQLIWSDVYTIAGIAFLLSLLATIYPARQAANINPAEALRYE